MTDPQTQRPADDFSQLFRNLRPHSLAAVKMAMIAMSAKAVGGTLVIQINTDANRPPEAYFSTAPSDLVSTLYRPIS